MKILAVFWSPVSMQVKATESFDGFWRPCRLLSGSRGKSRESGSHFLPISSQYHFLEPPKKKSLITHVYYYDLNCAFPLLGLVFARLLIIIVCEKLLPLSIFDDFQHILLPFLHFESFCVCICVHFVHTYSNFDSVWFNLGEFLIKFLFKISFLFHFGHQKDQKVRLHSHPHFLSFS